MLILRKFPPHTRGWTTHVGDQPWFTRVSPAHAGMDRVDIEANARFICFPRTRGDGPSCWMSHTAAESFPPHTRGWTLRVAPITRHARVSPAHAGMDPERRTPPRQLGCFPRTRGDGPGDLWWDTSGTLFPPHTRGWTRRRPLVKPALPVSPAHAGMDPQPGRISHPPFRFPRTRGDGPHRQVRDSRTHRFPPHTRGWTLSAQLQISDGLVSPAHAGMDPSR